jgi:TPR repeat protein
VEKNYKIANEYFELSNGKDDLLFENNSDLYKQTCMKNSQYLFELGHSYFDGLGFEKNYEKAFQYFIKSLESFPDNDSSLYALGKLYEYVYGVSVNYIKALNYYKLAILNNKNSINIYQKIMIN